MVVETKQLRQGELLRTDGLRIERLCKHGVGHPVRYTRELTEQEKEWVGVHGCCSEGCCCQPEWHREDLQSKSDEEC